MNNDSFFDCERNELPDKLRSLHSSKALAEWVGSLGERVYRQQTKRDDWLLGEGRKRRHYDAVEELICDKNITAGLLVREYRKNGRNVEMFELDFSLLRLMSMGLKLKIKKALPVWSERLAEEHRFCVTSRFLHFVWNPERSWSIFHLITSEDLMQKILSFIDPESHKHSEAHSGRFFHRPESTAEKPGKLGRLFPCDVDDDVNLTSCSFQ